MTYSYSNPLPGKYLTHAHNHITQAVAAKDSWLAVAFCLWEEGSGSPGENGGGRATGGRRWKVLIEWEAGGIK